MPGRASLAAACGLLLAAFPVGCADPPTVTPDAPPGPATVDPNAETLTIELLNTELAVGQERVAFRMYDQTGGVVGPESTVDTIFYRIVATTGEAQEAASGMAAFLGAGLPGGGSWVVYAPFDSSGTWGIDVNVARPDGWRGAGRFNVEVAARPSTPREGTAPPSGDNPVAAGSTPADAAAVTSDARPDPALYQMTIDEAAASGRPTVIHFGSPGHCVGDQCIAGLEHVKMVKATYADRVNFIHVETHDLADPARLSATALAWGLPSEPWTFVLNRFGRIAVRLEGAIDSTELGLLLDQQLQRPGGG